MSLRKTLIVTLGLSFATACTALIGLDDLPPAPPLPDAAPAPAPTTTAPSPVAEGGMPDGAGSGGDVKSAIATFGAAFCARYQQCNRVIFEVNYKDIDECKTSQVAQLAYQSSLPGSGATAKAYQDCATNTAALPCDQFTSRDADFACNLRGSRKADDRCVTSSQCESGFCGSDPKTCRVCAAPPASGSPCAANGGCGTGLVCNTKNVCVTQATATQSCSDEEKPCRVGLACVNEVCKALPATAGMPCGADGCDVTQGLACRASRCVSFVAVGAGGACTSTPDAPKLCLRLAACGDDGTCTAAPGEGQACLTEAQPGLCLPPLVCRDNKCAQPPASSTCQ